MSWFLGRPRLLLVLLAFLAAPACSPMGETSEQARVRLAFEAWKKAMIDYRTHDAMAYIPRHVDHYLGALNTSANANTSSMTPSGSDSPGVDLLLRDALEKKVPPDLRAKLTLDALVQRMANRHLLNRRTIAALDLGRVSVAGNHASAELYYQGTLTALRLPFLKEGDVWKIDVMALLPYAEILMRVDRAVKDQTEARQVDEIVSKLPSL